MLEARVSLGPIYTCDGIMVSSGPKKGTRGSHAPPEGGNNNLGGAQIAFMRLKNY